MILYIKWFVGAILYGCPYQYLRQCQNLGWREWGTISRNPDKLKWFVGARRFGCHYQYLRQCQNLLFREWGTISRNPENLGWREWGTISRTPDITGFREIRFAPFPKQISNIKLAKVLLYVVEFNLCTFLTQPTWFQGLKCRLTHTCHIGSNQECHSQYTHLLCWQFHHGANLQRAKIPRCCG